MTTGRINQVAVIKTIIRTECCRRTVHHSHSNYLRNMPPSPAGPSKHRLLHPCRPTPPATTTIATKPFLRPQCTYRTFTHMHQKESTTLFTPYFRHNQRQLSVAFLQKPHSTLPADRKHTHTRYMHPPLQAKPCIPSSQQQHNSTHNPKGEPQGTTCIAASPRLWPVSLLLKLSIA